MGTLALENQVHVSLNKTVIVENKVSSGLSRFAASSTILYCYTVGTQSCSCTPSPYLPSILLIPVFFYYCLWFLLFLHLQSITLVCITEIMRWFMALFCFYTLAVSSKLALSISFHVWLTSLIVDFLGRDKFLFWANLLAPFFVFIPVFCSPESPVTPHLFLLFLTSLSPSATDHLWGRTYSRWCFCKSQTDGP